MNVLMEDGNITGYKVNLEVTFVLADDPRPPGCKNLGGGDGYCIRVGEWRALYRVNDRERRVDVVRVAHRRDVYRR
jgi:mRNA interferase RelE/StbE